jgi:hypothetical protein
MGVAGYKTVKDQFVNVLRLHVEADARVEIGGAALNEEDH